MRRPIAAIASLALAPAAAAESIVVQIVVAETGATAEAVLERQGDALLAEAELFAALGLITPPGPFPARLDALPGARVTFDAARGVATLSCPPACFAAQRLGPPRGRSDAPSDQAGLFANIETGFDAIEGETTWRGLVELGAFGPGYFAETNFAAGDRTVRLDTRWTFDDPARRRRLVLGDSFSRAGAASAPIRFGGVQWGTDFTLAPDFVTFPTPMLAGEAAAPAFVDLYIDGALRLRTRAAPGPFSIEEAPVLGGAGVARVVVTDVFGREQTITQPFYASPAMLRPGLSDFSLAAGAARRGYGIESGAYRGAFASALWRRGVTGWLTAEAHVETVAGAHQASVSASATHALLGQFDVALAQGAAADGSGRFVSLGWTRAARAFSFAGALDLADADYARPGEKGAWGVRSRARASASWFDARAGGFSLALAAQDSRASPDVTTLALSYAPPLRGPVALGVNLLVTDSHARTTALSLSFTRPFGAATSGASFDWNGRGMQARADSKSAAPQGGGIGYQLSAGAGRSERFDAALLGRGARGEGEAAASQVDGALGVRGRYAFALARLGGETIVTRPLYAPFALIDAGAPNVAVSHDGRAAGMTDARGRLLVTDLRAYERNEIQIAADDLPGDRAVAADAIAVTPSARGGAIVRIAAEDGASLDTRVLNPSGAPLPRGGVLVRRGDGARFPIGADGRVFLTSARAGDAYDGPDCTALLSKLAGTLTCAPP